MSGTPMPSPAPVVRTGPPAGVVGLVGVVAVVVGLLGTSGALELTRRGLTRSPGAGLGGALAALLSAAVVSAGLALAGRVRWLLAGIGALLTLVGLLDLLAPSLLPWRHVDVGVLTRLSTPLYAGHVLVVGIVALVAGLVAEARRDRPAAAATGARVVGRVVAALASLVLLTVGTVGYVVYRTGYDRQVARFGRFDASATPTWLLLAMLVVVALAVALAFTWWGAPAPGGLAALLLGLVLSFGPTRFVERELYRGVFPVTFSASGFLRYHGLLLLGLAVVGCALAVRAAARDRRVAPQPYPAYAAAPGTWGQSGHDQPGAWGQSR